MPRNMQTLQKEQRNPTGGGSMRLILIALIPIAFIAGTHHESNLARSDTFYKQAIRDAYQLGRLSIVEEVIERDGGIEVAAR